MADSCSSNSSPAENNKTIATRAAPSVNTSVVRTNTEAASQVFNTPELLDLLLSKLDAKNVLLNASLVCRAFKASIDSSPTINKTLDFAVIDAVPAAFIYMCEGKFYYYCRNLCLYSTIGGSEIWFVLDFLKLPVEHYLSSPSFRKLRMLETSSQYDFSRAGQLALYESAEGGLTSKKLVPLGKCEERVMIAERLETAIAQLETGAGLVRLVISGQKIIFRGLGL
jgi:hypothetical protein